MPVCGPSLFGDNNRYIKVGNGELVAIDGSNVMEKLGLSELRMPYKQILKGRIILKPGQENYLLNHLGLGDNVTFLAIKATYEQKALEEDNYVIYKPYDNITCVSQFAQMMVLTGNSTNRIPQLFLTNPNPNYSVSLEVMLAIIDDETSFYNYKPVVYFTNNVTLEGTEYTEPYNTSMGDTFGANLDISYYSYSFTKSGLAYMLIDEVRDSNGVVMTTDDSNYILYDSNNNEVNEISTVGTYYMYFDITDSLGNSVDPVDNIVINVETLNQEPVIYFTDSVNLTGTTYSSPFNTSMGDDFTSSLSISYYSYSFTKPGLIYMLISEVIDSLGNVFTLTDDNITIFDSSNNEVTTIGVPGTYTLNFDITDSLGNSVSDLKNIELIVTQ